MPEFQYPVVGLLARESRLSAYVAWQEEDLLTCPLHDHLRNRHAQHTLVDAVGNTFTVRQAHLAGVDWHRARAVGLGAQLVSALFSFGNIPVRLTQRYEAAERLSLEDLRSKVRLAIQQQPNRYTLSRSEGAVKASLTKARTFGQLAAAISAVPAR